MPTTKLGKVARDVGLAVAAVLIAAAVDFLAAGGLEGTKYAGLGVVLLVALSALRRELFPPPESGNEPSIHDSGESLDWGPDIDALPLVADVGTGPIAIAVNRIAEQFRSSAGAKLSAIDPTWATLLAGILIQIIGKCRKQPPAIHEDLKGSLRWDRRKLRRQIIAAIKADVGRVPQLRRVADNLTNAIYHSACAASEKDFSDTCAALKAARRGG